MKKYEFTGETKQYEGRTLRKIRRLSDGLAGGWIEKESNLSHQGDCWVFSRAMVYGDAKVFGNARVSSRARIYGNAKVYGDARVYGNAWVFDDAEVYDNAWIFDNAEVYGKAKVSGNAIVSDNTEVTCKVFSLNYREDNITMTDYHVRISGKQMLAYEWLHLEVDDAVRMEFNRKEFPGLKALLEVTIPDHFERELN